MASNDTRIDQQKKNAQRVSTGTSVREPLVYRCGREHARRILDNRRETIVEKSHRVRLISIAHFHARGHDARRTISNWKDPKFTSCCARECFRPINYGTVRITWVLPFPVSLSWGWHAVGLSVYIKVHLWTRKWKTIFKRTEFV